MDDVLILDDNATDCEHICRALDGMQFKLHTASCGADALKICNDTAISIVLVDYVVGIENGIEIFEELLHSRPFLRGILISGYLDYGLLTRIVESRFDDCLKKPIDAETLRDSLMNSLRNIVHWRARFKEHRAVIEQDDFITDYAHFMKEIDDKTYVVNGKYMLENNLLDRLISRIWTETVFLCIDLSGINSIHSTHIGGFVALKNAVKKRGGDVGLYGMSDHVLSVMKSLRLFDIFYGSQSQTEILEKIHL
ncbi:MAG: response regulator [Planctomycetes bacterium]|nr:response regulator [Planctomycetota bacterium]